MKAGHMRCGLSHTGRGEAFRQREGGNLGWHLGVHPGKGDGAIKGTS